MRIAQHGEPNIVIPGQVVFVCDKDLASLGDMPNLWRGAGEQERVSRARQGSQIRTSWSFSAAGGCKNCTGLRLNKTWGW